MAKQTFKWIEVKKSRLDLSCAQVDISHLNKKGVDLEWNRLEKKYPNHLMCEVSSKRDLAPHFFENDPK
ncbi:hypothetical protein [Sphingobacterium multivorum]|uniref:hypothetical protein n=1 Tax=Sphingobacterium multivorum TaxID=28454 RepID=UPI0031BA8DFA